MPEQENYKTYHLCLNERNRGYDYYFDLLIYAKNEVDAWDIAEQHGGNFYADGERPNDDEAVWKFNNGEIIVSIYDMKEMTEKEYIKMMFGCRFVVNPHNAALPEYAA